MFVLLWNPVVPKNDYTIDFLARHPSPAFR
jgi:hypothetical protein